MANLDATYKYLVQQVSTDFLINQKYLFSRILLKNYGAFEICLFSKKLSIINYYKYY